MKKILTGIFCLGTTICCAQTPAPDPEKDTAFLQPVEVSTVKASERNPFAKTNLTEAEIKKLNVGQDLPLILNNTPSVTVNSDAGNGVGYTGIRIRGTDATRINVTLNGIPYNDAESLGTFFVDLPDIASSAKNIQIQRGVGTSANGAGSFGGSINLSTNELTKVRSVELNSTAGSYETCKNTFIVHTGLIKKHFTLDARASNIRSQGYVDRAASRLASFYFSPAYTDEKHSLRFNIFSGKEVTYQSWYGVNAETLDTNRRYNSAGTAKPGEPYRNETDNYRQTHYQLFYNHKFNPRLRSNLAFFLTRGKGYYEQYRADVDFDDYGLDANLLPGTTDLVRRLWLDNYFYGSVFSLQYERERTQLLFGGGLNSYDGKHYGTIAALIGRGPYDEGYHWYKNSAKKTDASAYIKWTQNISKHFETFVDVQARHINYRINGFRDNPGITLRNDYLFFNPKAGITHRTDRFKSYVSFARAVKEPVRADFESAVNQMPEPEKLNDIEAGTEYRNKKFNAALNLYYMRYRDQLVLNGKVNDVGAYTRVNVPQSYRAGAELSAASVLNKYITLAGNITLSRNRIKNFTEFIDDYDNGGQLAINRGETDISFSPNVIAAFNATVNPFKNAEIFLTSKYVGKQYLDNSSLSNRKLNDYFTQDARAGYTWKISNGKSQKPNENRQVNVFVQVNNIFSRLYEPNGYSFSYVYGGDLTTENYYFPMAPVNFLIGLNLKL